MISGRHHPIVLRSFLVIEKVNTVFGSTINGASALTGLTAMHSTLKSSTITEGLKCPNLKCLPSIRVRFCTKTS